MSTRPLSIPHNYKQSSTNHPYPDGLKKALETKDYNRELIAKDKQVLEGNKAKIFLRQTLMMQMKDEVGLWPKEDSPPQGDTFTSTKGVEEEKK